MHRLFRLMALLLALLMPVCTCAEDAPLTLTAEYPIPFQLAPVSEYMGLYPLPNGGVFLVYDVEDPEIRAMYAQFGTYDVRTQHMMLLAPDGSLIWDEGGSNSYDWNDEIDFLWQVVIGQESFAFEFYIDHEMGLCNIAEWDFAGKLLNDRLAAHTFEDSEKRYVWNLPSYTVSYYPFGADSLIPMTITSHTTGITKTYTLMYGEQFDFFEADGELIVLSMNENDEHTFRFFSPDGQLIRQIPAPGDYFSGVVGDESSLYFFTLDASLGYAAYVYNKAAETFLDEPITFLMDDDRFTLEVIAVLEDGFVAVQTDELDETAGSQLVLLSRGGLMTVLEDWGLRADDVRVQGDTCILRLRDPANGEQFIRKYAVHHE